MKRKNSQMHNELEEKQLPTRRRMNAYALHTLLTGGTNIALALLGMLTGIIAARLLGPQGRGELAAIQLWPSFIASIAMLGLPEALVYYSAREPKRAGQYLGTAMAIALASSCMAMMIGYFTLPILLSAQGDKLVQAARWYLFLIPVFALVGLPYHPLRGLGLFAVWNSLRIAPGLIWLLVLGLAWVLNLAHPTTLAFMYLTGLALLFFPVSYQVVSTVPRPYRPALHQCSALLSFGLPSVAATLPQLLNMRLDQMLMAALLPVESLGLYVVAVAWGGATQPLLIAIGTVLFPKVASQSNLKQQLNAFTQGIRVGVLSASALAGVLFTLTSWALPFLFGHRFTAAVPTCLVLVIAGAIAGINSIMQEGLRGLGWPISVMWAELGGLVVTGIALVCLLRPLGILGAGFASLLGRSAVMILLVVQVSLRTGLKPDFILKPTTDELRLALQQIKNIMKIAVPI